MNKVSKKEPISNSGLIHFPFFCDVTGQPSVSLTILMISVAAVVGTIVLTLVTNKDQKAAEMVKDFFYSSSMLYFSRRLKHPWSDLKGKNDK